MHSPKLVLVLGVSLLAVTGIFSGYAQSITIWLTTATSWLPAVVAGLTVVGGAILFSRLGRRSRRHFRR